MSVIQNINQFITSVSFFCWKKSIYKLLTERDLRLGCWQADCSVTSFSQSELNRVKRGGDVEWGQGGLSGEIRGDYGCVWQWPIQWPCYFCTLFLFSIERVWLWAFCCPCDWIVQSYCVHAASRWCNHVSDHGGYLGVKGSFSST